MCTKFVFLFHHTLTEKIAEKAKQNKTTTKNLSHANLQYGILPSFFFKEWLTELSIRKC
jgi:hypothetical protein